MKFAETWPPTSGKVSVRLVATAPSSDFVLRGNSILGSGLESLCKAFTKAGGTAAVPIMVLTRCSPLTLLLRQSRKALQLVRSCFGELNSGREELHELIRS